MRAHVLVLGFTAAIAAASLVPRSASAQTSAASSAPPTFQYSIREAEAQPPLPLIVPNPGLSTRTPPRYDLLWSDVLEEAVSTLRAFTDVSATELSALLQPGPIDALIPAEPAAFMPDGTPPEVPTGVSIGRRLRLQPVAIISPVPTGTEIQGQQAVLPSAVMQLPWMIP